MHGIKGTQSDEYNVYSDKAPTTPYDTNHIGWIGSATYVGEGWPEL